MFQTEILIIPMAPYYTMTPVFRVLLAYKTGSPLASWVKVEAAVLGSLSLIRFMISADVKQQ